MLRMKRGRNAERRFFALPRGLSSPLIGRNGALVDIEKSHVIVGDLVKQNDELHEVCIRLLPEGFFPLAEQIVQERGDAVCQRVGIEVVVQWVVAVLGIEADFDVILCTAMPGENLLHLMAEVAFYFENQSADLFVAILGFIGDKLLDKRIHATTGLAGANCADDGNSGEKPALRDREPAGCFRWYGPAWVVDLADNEKHVLPLARIGIAGQASCRDLPMGLQSEDVQARKKNGEDDVWRREEEEGIGPLYAFENERGAESHELEENVLFREWNIEVECHPRDRRQHEGYKVLRIDEPLDHDFFTSAGGAGLRAFLCSFCSRSNSLSREKTNRSADATT
jgi:hypothetical protein